jgi:uncharacterized protein (DUF1697 family)
MIVVVSLLRGVNVGGRHLIKMEVLRGLCAGLGWCDAQTYVQSGNIIFRTSRRDLDGISNRLAGCIAENAGFRPEVMVRTAAGTGAGQAGRPVSRR